MVQVLVRIALVALAMTLGSHAVASEPIMLKLAYFSSDQASTYRDTIKPFVDAVNLEGHGQVRVEIAFSGALGRDPVKQAQMVLNGTADIAFVVPGYTPSLFPDDRVIQLPGLFPTNATAARTYSKLVAENALRGYDQFHVISVFTGGEETIHSRPPISSLADLAGKRIRVSNALDAAVVEKLGATAVFMPITQIANALANDEIDAATMAWQPLVEFSIARFATHHYLLGLSNIPLALLMNRDKFAALPESVRKIIRKYSGSWLTEHSIAGRKATNERLYGELKTNPQRTFIEPSTADRVRAEAVFGQVVEDWLRAAPRNAELLAKVKAELAKSE